MFKVIIMPVAKQDIKDAVLWYNSRQEDLGKRFVKEVRLKIGFIKRAPFIYAVKHDDTRAAVLDIFPFMIHFEVDESQKLIIIYAVLHTSRSPATWDVNRNLR